MEAMIMGVPVVATQGGGVPELIEDKIEGLLVPSRDPKLLSQAIMQYLENPELAISISKAGQEKILCSFQSNKSAKIIFDRVKGVDERNVNVQVDA